MERKDGACRGLGVRDGLAARAKQARHRETLPAPSLGNGPCASCPLALVPATGTLENRALQACQSQHCPSAPRSLMIQLMAPTCSSWSVCANDLACMPCPPPESVCYPASPHCKPTVSLQLWTFTRWTEAHWVTLVDSPQLAYVAPQLICPASVKLIRKAVAATVRDSCSFGEKEMARGEECLQRRQCFAPGPETLNASQTALLTAQSCIRMPD